ncbi:efflux RND transporter periplasmic adaptor subunit [Reichenbachiella carrageenanivorans]|uniref:Efflux RND transporter periplasmic adaptor subunit n=1 Tax=Reichenbachiella carrageenanivorans TaxID=2979869 RepID=A0ABY6CWZ2_9BACT|nr:efflux RND transporter periplasmic adaptor subunit [Reichenbachiella carrageenanivorans]UXX78446.1 efflux RND transporter periplasmic adaptor subunit [Reichenbachiella carrageenanivorans]
MNNTFKRYKQLLASAMVWSLVMSACTSPQVAEEDHHEEEDLVELTPAQFERAGIVMGKIEKRTIGSELKVNGMIDVPPQSNISINMPYGGFVKYTEMLPGTQVKKGQFLVSIQNPEFIQFQQSYLESLASREYLKMEYERQKSLFNEKVASGKNYQQAKSNYLSNEARLQAMKARLELIGFNPKRIAEEQVSAVVNIYSPENGSVRDVYTNIGKYVNPQDVIMDITNADDLHVELTVYENDIPKIKTGQRIRFSLANEESIWREAEIFLVGSGVREDRSVTVHGHLKEEQSDLMPGMYVNAKIEIGSHEVWAVPAVSIVRFNGKHYLFTAAAAAAAAAAAHNEKEDNLHFDMREVTVGATEDEYTAIALVDDSVKVETLGVVVKGAFTLLAKAKNSEEEGGHHH